MDDYPAVIPLWSLLGHTIHCAFIFEVVSKLSMLAAEHQSQMAKSSGKALQYDPL